MEYTENIEDIVNNLERLRSYFQKDLSLEHALPLLEEAYTYFQQGNNCLATPNHQCSVLTLDADGAPVYDIDGNLLSQSLTTETQQL